MFNFGSVANPFGTPVASKTTQKSTYELFGIKEQKFPSFHFGTGTIFDSVTDPKKQFAALELENHIDPNAQLPSTAPLKQEGSKETENGDDVIENSIRKGETGEENDEVLFNERAVLMIFQKREGDDKPKWYEKGTGEFHFNKSSDFYRITMRRDALSRIILNARVTKHNSPQIIGKNKAFVKFLALQSTEEGTVIPQQIMYARFRSPESASKLFELWEEKIKEIKE